MEKPGNSLKLLVAGAFLAPPCVGAVILIPEVQVPCQHQPLMSMSQRRGLHMLKANDSSFVLGTEANIPSSFGGTVPCDKQSTAQALSSWSAVPAPA